MSRKGEAFDQVERELQRERAAALLRIATQLELLIARLEELRQLRARPGGDSEAVRHAYAATRKDALRYRWYLEVQRESIGLTRHAVLDALYVVPGPLPD